MTAAVQVDSWAIDGPAPDAATALLSVDERARRDRFVFDRDADRFTLARAGLRSRLGDAVAQRPDTIRFDYGARGKPGLPGNPVWFNLSHSEGLAVLAISQTAQVGVDVELPGRAFLKGEDTLMNLARRCFTDGECDVVRDLPLAERETRFLEFWTAKEARMKVTGEGMALEPRSIRLTLADGHPVGFSDDAAPVDLSRVPLSDRGAICHVATLEAAR